MAPDSPKSATGPASLSEVAEKHAQKFIKDFAPLHADGKTKVSVQQLNWAIADAIEAFSALKSVHLEGYGMGLTAGRWLESVQRARPWKTVKINGVFSIKEILPDREKHVVVLVDKPGEVEANAIVDAHNNSVQSESVQREKQDQFRSCIATLVSVIDVGLPKDRIRHILDWARTLISPSAEAPGPSERKDASIPQMELLRAVEEFMREAVVLSADYLETFRDKPDNTTIQGWEKARWLRALAAKRRLRSALQEFPAPSAEPQSPSAGEKKDLGK